MTSITIEAALRACMRDHALDHTDCRILLGVATGMSRVQIMAHPDQPLDETRRQYFNTLVARRAGGEPIAYILGEREFYGRVFRVTPAVLIPRPETELLVELALQRLVAGSRVLDLGTGSGAIAVTLALEAPGAVVTACDISGASLDVARDNAARLGADVRMLESDWYAAVGGETFDCIVANPPYIARDDAHLSQGDLRFEPRAALTDDADGLDALRAIVAGAPQRLVDGGWVLVEHGHDQAAAVRALLDAVGLTQVGSWRDLAGIERVSGACRLGAGFASPAGLSAGSGRLD